MQARGVCSNLRALRDPPAVVAVALTCAYCCAATPPIFTQQARWTLPGIQTQHQEVRLPIESRLGDHPRQQPASTSGRGDQTEVSSSLHQPALLSRPTPVSRRRRRQPSSTQPRPVLAAVSPSSTQAQTSRAAAVAMLQEVYREQASNRAASGPEGAAALSAKTTQIQLDSTDELDETQYLHTLNQLPSWDISGQNDPQKFDWSGRTDYGAIQRKVQDHVPYQIGCDANNKSVKLHEHEACSMYRENFWAKTNMDLKVCMQSQGTHFLHLCLTHFPQASLTAIFD